MSAKTHPPLHPHPQRRVPPPLARLAENDLVYFIVDMTAALDRQWRGTLIPSIVLRGVSNGLIMLLLIVVLGVYRSVLGRFSLLHDELKLIRMSGEASETTLEL